MGSEVIPIKEVVRALKHKIVYSVGDTVFAKERNGAIAVLEYEVTSISISIVKNSNQTLDYRVSYGIVSLYSGAHISCHQGDLYKDLESCLESIREEVLKVRLKKKAK